MLPADELRRRIERYRGEKMNYRPPSGTGKSTKIVVWDIALMADIASCSVFRFLAGTEKFGEKRRRKISRIVMLVDAGRVTKSQHGVYKFHDEPVAQAARGQRVNVDLRNGISLTNQMQEVAPPTMPEFLNVFGRK